VQVPEWLSERVPFLDTLEDDWQPLPRWAMIVWLVFYALFVWSAATQGTIFHLADLVFLPVHEGGHLLFRFFGEWLMAAGGTILQLFAPFALAVYFVFRRQIAGTAFCVFFLFEQFLPIATYMADARAQALPLVTVGDPDLAVHDWFYLFSSVHLLQHDTQIAAAVRVFGWLGMLATIAWLLLRSERSGGRV
jgi:hypothetical protein